MFNRFFTYRVERHNYTDRLPVSEMTYTVSVEWDVKLYYTVPYHTDRLISINTKIWHLKLPFNGI